MSNLAAQVVVAHLLRCEPKVQAGFIEYTEPESRVDDEAIVFAGGPVDLVQRGLDAGLDRATARREAVTIFEFVHDAMQAHANLIARVRGELAKGNLTAIRVKLLCKAVAQNK